MINVELKRNGGHIDQYVPVTNENKKLSIFKDNEEMNKTIDVLFNPDKNIDRNDIIKLFKSSLEKLKNWEKNYQNFDKEEKQKYIQCSNDLIFSYRVFLGREDFDINTSEIKEENIRQIIETMDKTKGESSKEYYDYVRDSYLGLIKEVILKPSVSLGLVNYLFEKVEKWEGSEKLSLYKEKYLIDKILNPVNMTDSDFHSVCEEIVKDEQNLKDSHLMYKILEKYFFEHDLIKENNYQKLINYVDEKLYNQFGFSIDLLKRMYTRWRKIEDNLNNKESFLRGYEGITELMDVASKKDKKNIIRTLNQDFGICNFFRYETNLLLKQYQEKENKEKNFVLMVYANYDENGVFSKKGHKERINNFRKKLDDSDILLRTIECEKISEAYKFMLTLGEKKYPNKMVHLLIVAHGNDDRICFSEDSILKKENISSDDKGRMRRISKNFDDNKTDPSVPSVPSVVLYSCNTGAEGGIAENIAYELSRSDQSFEIIAPRKSVFDIKLNYQKGGIKPSYYEYRPNDKSLENYLLMKTNEGAVYLTDKIKERKDLVNNDINFLLNSSNFSLTNSDIINTVKNYNIEKVNLDNMNLLEISELEYKIDEIKKKYKNLLIQKNIKNNLNIIVKLSKSKKKDLLIKKYINIDRDISKLKDSCSFKDIESINASIDNFNKS